MNNNTERNPFDGWIGDEGEQGMTTLTQSGQLSNDKSIVTRLIKFNIIDTEKTYEPTEISSFISEDGADYTDLRKPTCPCTE